MINRVRVTPWTHVHTTGFVGLDGNARVRSIFWMTLEKIASPAMRLMMSTIDLISF